MQTMEYNVYDKIADFLALIGRTELLTCSATQNSFGKIRDQAHQLTREYNLQCTYLFYPVLKQHIQYEFESCDADPVRKITADHESVLQTLNHEGKRWAGRVARENHSIRENSRRIAAYQALRDQGQRFDPNDQNGPDLDTKIEECAEQIRKSEIIKIKAEAKLEALKIGGISVEDWIQEAETMSVQEIPRSSSEASLRTDGENPSSDSFYDSDNAEVEARSQFKQVATTAATSKTVEDKRDAYRESFHESSEFEDDDEDERPPPQQQAPVQQESFAAWDGKL
jgi:F-BAR and double SH3 domains protein